MAALDTIDVSTITDHIMGVMAREFNKAAGRLSEENGEIELSFITVANMANRVLMAVDSVMRKAAVFTFQLCHNEVRPSIEMIVAASLTDRVAPRVHDTRPLVEVMVASVLADHAAAVAVEESR